MIEYVAVGVLCLASGVEPEASKGSAISTIGGAPLEAAPAFIPDAAMSSATEKFWIPASLSLSPGMTTHDRPRSFSLDRPLGCFRACRPSVPLRPRGRRGWGEVRDFFVAAGAHLTLPVTLRRVPSLSALKGGEGNWVRSGYPWNNSRWVPARTNTIPPFRPIASFAR